MYGAPHSCGGRRFGVWLSILFLTVTNLGELSAQTTTPKPQFVISTFDLGATDHPKATPEQVAQLLEDEGWCLAQPATAASAWNRVPAGADVSKWVSVISAGFHETSDVYAMMFDGPSGSLSLVAQYRNHKIYSQGALVWPVPFAKLNNGFKTEWLDTNRNSGRRLLSIKITQTTAPAVANTAVASTNTLAVEEALTVPPEKVLPPIEAIVFAAAYEAGWAPTTRATEATAAVEVRVRDQACAIKLTLNRDGRTRVVEKDRIPWQEYHEQLVRMFQLPALGDEVTDFMRLDPESLKLLATGDDRLYGVGNDELAAWNLNTGQQAWQLRLVQPKFGLRKTEQYTARTNRSGIGHLYRFTRTLAEIDPAEGKEKVLAPMPVAQAWAFDVDGNVAATINGMTVSLHRDGKTSSTANEVYPITCGPSLTADSVVAGNANGELFALSLADGKERWRLPLGGRLYGPLSALGDKLIAFSSDAETIYAVDPATGKLAWQQAVGDALLEEPQLMAGGLLVVTKSNRLLLVNPADGKILKEATWPTWLVSVRPLPVAEKLIACTDIDGRVSLVSQESLTTTSSVRLPVNLSGPLVFVPKMRSLWPREKAPKSDDVLSAIDDAAVPAGPSLLVSDDEGFLYVVSIPGGK